MKIASLILTLLWSSVGAAEVLVLDYKSFYNHVKKLDNEDTAALRFAFGFKHVRKANTLCPIRNATIETPKKNIPLVVSDEQRFTVPSEKALKLADAKVVIDLADTPANLCDMSVQLETQPQWLKTHYSRQQLHTLLEHYKAFFDDMGGILSFLMPKVTGLVFHFDEAAGEEISDLDYNDDSEGKVTVSEETLLSGKGMKFRQVPFRITAHTSN